MSETIVEGLEAVAAHFRKTVRQVRNWRRAGMPALSGNRFDLEQIGAWRAQKKGGRGPAAVVAPAAYGQGKLIAEGDKDYWDKEGKRYQAEIRKLDFRKRQEELVEVREMEQHIIGCILAVKQGLQSLVQVLPELEGKTAREMEPIFTRACRQLLAAFARPLPENLGGFAPPPELWDFPDEGEVGGSPGDEPLHGAPNPPGNGESSPNMA